MNRVMLLANEKKDFQQIGFRRPLSNLKNAGLIEDFLVESPELDYAEGMPLDDLNESLVRAAKRFKPTQILIMHPHRMHLASSTLKEFRKISSPEIILWEGDAYSLLRKQPNFTDIAVARMSDVVWTVGKGSLRFNLRLYGARDVRWIPHCFETDRLRSNSPIRNSSGFIHDLSIIANKSGHRFRPAPGWRERVEFVSKCQEALPDQVSVFGWGWEGPGAKGKLDFNEQYRVISGSRITGNWDHYPRTNSYFSNRLPISLAAGSVHATTWHPGYNEIFPKMTSQFLLLEKTPKALVERIVNFLSSTDDETISQLGFAASVYAFKHFRQDDWIVKMLNSRAERINPREASESWSLNS